jgi:hypothetical protein
MRLSCFWDNSRSNTTTRYSDLIYLTTEVQSLLYVSPGLTFQDSTFCLQITFMCLVIHTTSSSGFSAHDYADVLCNRGRLCYLRDMKLITNMIEVNCGLQTVNCLHCTLQNNVAIFRVHEVSIMSSNRT